MKAIQIMWRILIVLCLFAVSDCFAVRGKRSGLQSRQLRSGVQRSKNRSAAANRIVRGTADGRVGEAGSIDEQMAGGSSEVIEKESFSSEEDYIKSLEPEVQELFNRADRLSEIGNKAEAIKLFELLADKHQVPLAFDRLGDIHLAMADDDPGNVVIAQRYFGMALEKGWIAALEKLLKVGQILAKIVEE